MNFSTAGKGTYFNLEPGYRLCYRDGALTRTMTVRRKTKLVAGVQTRVVEEKEEKDGQTTKVLWKYYAIDKATSAVYCFGVHVRSYHNGELVGHSGWCAGVNGAVFSLAVPASPKPGDTLPRRKCATGVPSDRNQSQGQDPGRNVHELSSHPGHGERRRWRA